MNVFSLLFWISDVGTHHRSYLFTLILMLEPSVPIKDVDGIKLPSTLILTLSWGRGCSKEKFGQMKTWSAKKATLITTSRDSRDWQVITYQSILCGEYFYWQIFNTAWKDKETANRLGEGYKLVWKDPTFHHSTTMATQTTQVTNKNTQLLCN